MPSPLSTAQCYLAEHVVGPVGQRRLLGSHHAGEQARLGRGERDELLPLVGRQGGEAQLQQRAAPREGSQVGPRHSLTVDRSTERQTVRLTVCA